MTSEPQILTALGTGASRGIGRAVACSLARRGARVAIHYQANAGAARETLAALTGTGHALFAADLADPAAAARLWNAVVAKFGRIGDRRGGDFLCFGRARGHDGRHHRSEWGALPA